MITADVSATVAAGVAAAVHVPAAVAANVAAEDKGVEVIKVDMTCSKGAPPPAGMGE
jgi:hypothetical protein